jgi:hypothetical protein
MVSHARDVCQDYYHCYFVACNYINTQFMLVITNIIVIISNICFFFLTVFLRKTKVRAWWFTLIIPVIWEAGARIVISANAGKVRKTYLKKQMQTKRDEGMAQVVEHLPSTENPWIKYPNPKYRKRQQQQKKIITNFG